jgi:hypothetical protein
MPLAKILERLDYLSEWAQALLKNYEEGPEEFPRDLLRELVSLAAKAKDAA